MFGLSYLKLGALLALALFAAWAFRVNSLRADWKLKHENLTAETVVVRNAVRGAADNPKLIWRDTAEQVRLLGEAKKAWQSTATLQSERIAGMGKEAARLKLLGAAERAKAEKAIAQRNGALVKLDNLALTPGERADLQGQLNAAVAALDLVFKEGL